MRATEVSLLQSQLFFLQADLLRVGPVEDDEGVLGAVDRGDGLQVDEQLVAARPRGDGVHEADRIAGGEGAAVAARDDELARQDGLGAGDELHEQAVAPVAFPADDPRGLERKDLGGHPEVGVEVGHHARVVLAHVDDHLPFAVSGWTRGAECYKEDNGYQCHTVADCTSRSGNFCDRFDGKYRGRDLAQVVFYKRAGSNEPGSYSFNLNKDSSGHPGWAILTTLRGANTTSPIRDSAHRGCDGNSDSLFPSVYGKKGDMLLLSQSFDDAVSQSRFGAPDGMSTFGYVSNSDEAGFLFGSVLDRDGESGERKTRGEGASSCKDALVSVTIKAD